MDECVEHLVKVTRSDRIEHIKFRNGIIQSFEPKFRSIAKDCDRYFNALFDLSEQGLIDTKNVAQYSATGSLWIWYQYIENGFLDLVEAQLERDVTSRDFYGPLFENTTLVLARLWEKQEPQRVLSIHKSALVHRLKAIRAESATSKDVAKGRTARLASENWLKHYLPAFQGIIAEYEALLKTANTGDDELEDMRDAGRSCDLGL